MNKQLTEIAGKCWASRTDGLHFDQDLFAKLVIEECLESVYDEIQYINAHKEAKYVCDKIKEKFGITD